MVAHRRLFGCAALIALLLSLPAAAHHAATVFDRKESIQKTGEVVQFIYRNPHLIINMEVATDSGGTELWKIEGQSIAALRQKGFVRSTVSVGDVITVRMRPLKSGEPGGLLQGLIDADGKAYSMDGSAVTPQEDATTGERLAAPRFGRVRCAAGGR